MTPSSDRVQWVYSAGTKEELGRRYDEWAGEYDKDIADDFGYLGPTRAAEVFARHVTSDAVVLDAGAGTGLVGVELARLGFGTIDAIDLSQGMLDEAGRKGMYRRLRQMDMTEPLDIADDAYDSCICVGTLTFGHVPASAIDELVRVTKRGGVLVYTLRPDLLDSHGFAAKHAELESTGKWRLIEKSDAFQGLPKGEPDIHYNVWVFGIL